MESILQTIEVENIKCNGCISTITKRLCSLEGVETVDVDREFETITVLASTPREVLVHELTDMGYPERGQNSLGAKVHSYISCARGKFTDK